MVVRFLGQIRDVLVEPAPKLGCLRHNLHFSRCRSEQPKEAIHCGRFARAILPHEREEIPITHVQSQAVECSHLSAQKLRSEVDMEVFSSYHIAPEQKRL